VDEENEYITPWMSAPTPTTNPATNPTLIPRPTSESSSVANIVYNDKTRRDNYPRRLYPDVQLKDAINTLYINADSIVFGTDEETITDNGDFVERKIYSIEAGE
jgi:hypothetical protein